MPLTGDRLVGTIQSQTKSAFLFLFGREVTVLTSRPNYPSGICVEPENPVALAQGLGKLASDPSLRRNLGENGSRDVFANYDHNEIAPRFAGLLPGATCMPVFSIWQAN